MAGDEEIVAGATEHAVIASISAMTQFAGGCQTKGMTGSITSAPMAFE